MQSAPGSACGIVYFVKSANRENNLIEWGNQFVDRAKKNMNYFVIPNNIRKVNELYTKKIPFSSLDNPLYINRF